MLEFLANLFRSDFLPHGVCYRWSPGVVWLHVVSDLLIALSYFFIPFALIYIARRRSDLVYPWMFWLFGAFILACGTTHLVSVWVVWYPYYRLDGAIKLLTAIASVPTAILLLRVAPAVAELPSHEQLRIANRELETQIAERDAAESEVRKLNAELEQRVAERTRELQETNNRLRQSESRMQAILDAAPVLVYMKDPDGRFVFVNRRFEDTFERRREQLAGCTDYDLFPAPDADTYREADRRVMTTRDPLEIEEVVYQGSEKRTYISVKFPLFDSEGSPYALCGISADITDRKTAEDALRRYNSELEQFAFVSAHDLQEPIRTVKTYAQLLKRRYEGALDAEGDEFIHYIVAGTDRMSLLVSDLRTYTEVATRSSPKRVRCDLNVILSGVRQDLGASIVETSASILLLEPLPVVDANARQMSQLFQNLISNAMKYRGSEPPRIEVSARLEGREWTFLVRDNGIGLDMKYANQIFGVFKRLHGREVPGTGIGLAICKQIVELHGGRIWVESSPGAGSTFVFTLPA